MNLNDLLNRFLGLKSNAISNSIQISVPEVLGNTQITTHKILSKENRLG